jgi:hypothetical protein
MAPPFTCSFVTRIAIPAGCALALPGAVVLVDTSAWIEVFRRRQRLAIEDVVDAVELYRRARPA